MNVVSIGLLALIFAGQVYSQSNPPVAAPVCGGLKQTPLATAECCQGLKLNTTTNLCEDPIQDSTLQVCVFDVDCAATQPGKGTGCFPQTEDDLFSAEATNPNQFTPISDLQDTVDDDRDANSNEPVAAGQACTKSSDCISYACDSATLKCLDRRICRLGDVGDLVRDGVRCEEGLIRNANSECDLTDQDKLLLYPLLINDDIIVKETNSCDFREYQNDPQMKEIRERSIVSMKTIRAMEWLFVNSTLQESEECLKLLPYMREGMAIPFYAERKTILTNFNIEMAKIEKDNQTLETAKDTSNTMTSIHGEAIKEKDLATRRTSGYDALKLMWRRNLLFQSYEKAMKELITAAGSKVGGLALEMGNWKDKGKEWKVGDKTWNAGTAGTCRGKKSEKIKKRWAAYFQVNASGPENAEVVKSKTIADYLALVNGESPESVTSTLVNGPKNTKFKNYFLVDPLMPGNKGTDTFDKFGTGKPGKRTLPEGSYPALRKAFKASIISHFRSMKGAGAPEEFVFEPEIVKMEARNCIDKPDGPNCELYTAFIEEMTDIAFAQFLAYSIHSKNSYKRYFSQANMRRKLLAKYETDMQNITKYYESMATARTDQNSCLEKAMNQIVADFIDDGAGVQLDVTGPSTSGSNSGSSTGSSLGGGTLNGTSTATGSANVNGLGTSGSGTKDSLRVTTVSRLPFSADLRFGSLKNMTKGGMMDNISGSSSLGSGSFSSSSNNKQFAANFNNMKTINSTALAKGINLAAKEKTLLPSLKNLSKSSSSSSANPSKVASNGLGSSGVALEIVPTNLEKEAEMDLKRKVIETGEAKVTADKTSPARPTPLTGTYPQTGSLGSTPISTSDQEIIEASYERTKREFISDEEDPLFSKVSKAYVRNLDKILTKKKKIEE